ncbi:MAG: HAMP domain-containing histidine kinase [Gammaproteobacteria bacterium]|nr:HAMP domain-containing histidine kinase [Gammaproteobacteria bacterium]
MSSIARRLGLWMVIGGGALLAALFATLDHLVDSQLHERFDGALVARAQAFANVIAAREASERQLVDAWPEFAPTRHEDFYQIWNSAGEVLGRAASNRGGDLARPPRAADAEPTLFDLTLPDGHRGRGVLLAVWPRQGGTVRQAPWTVVVASEREAVDALEWRIHLILSYGLAFALLLMLALTLAAVRAGLKPLREFGEDAARRALAPQAASNTPLLPSELVPIGRSLDRAFQALGDALVREQRFARAVAHELRTPLAEMQFTLDRLARDDASAAPRMAILNDSLASMTRTVDGLLALARYEAGLETPAIEPLELCALVKRVCDERVASSAARALLIDTALPAEAWVQSDAALLERVLSNLIGNALDHSPHGARVALSVVIENARATFAIVNPAPLLGAADVPQLGERYFRPASAPLDREHVGLGLALSTAIARQLQLELEFSLHDGLLQVRLGGLPVL